MDTIAIVSANKPFCIEECLKGLDLLEAPKKELKLLIIDRSGNKEITNKFLDYLNVNEDLWKTVQLIDEPQKDQVLYEPRHDDKELFLRKRWNVAETMNLMNKHRTGDVFLIEEDNIPTPQAYVRLRAICEWSDKIGAATGVTYSRNANQNICTPTIWKFSTNRLYPDGELNDGNTVRSYKIPEKEFGIESIGASGTGCMYYKSKVLNNYHFVGVGPFGFSGQDVNVGFNITMLKKYYMMVDWGIKTKHLGEDINGDIQEFTSNIYGGEYDFYSN